MTLSNGFLGNISPISTLQPNSLTKGWNLVMFYRIDSVIIRTHLC